MTKPPWTISPSATMHEHVRHEQDDDLLGPGFR